MAKIDFINKVEQAIEFGMIKKEPRDYLGYSGLGDKCLRKLWMDLHWCYDQQVEPRIQRIFDRGHAEENIIINDLERAGMQVTDRELEVVGLAGHIKGHLDGIVSKVPGSDHQQLLLEMKTMKASKFKEYKKNGLKRFNSRYWGQIHSYMGKANLPACLYVVTCKDNEERDYKIMPYDESAFNDMERVAVAVLTAEEIPERIGDKTWFACKFCSAKGTCHGGNQVKRNCRTCEHVDIEDNGVWSCSIDNGKMLTVKEQKLNCKKYKRMECLED